MREQVADQAKAFLGGVRRGRQTQVHQGERWGRRQLAQQSDRRLARIDGQHVVIRAEREGEGVGNERVVVDDEQRRPRRALIAHGYTS